MPEQKIAILDDNPDWVLDFAKDFNTEHTGQARITTIGYLTAPGRADNYKTLIEPGTAGHDGIKAWTSDRFEFQWVGFWDLLAQHDLVLIDYDMGRVYFNGQAFLADAVWDRATSDQRKKIRVYTSVGSLRQRVASRFPGQSLNAEAYRSDGVIRVSIDVGPINFADLCPGT